MMTQKLKIVLIVALLVLIFDLATKAVIVHFMPIGSVHVVIPNYFDIVHVRNTGAAFGIMSDWHSPLKSVVFLGVAFIAFTMVLWYIRSTPITDKKAFWTYGAIVGGALGNIIDRFWHGSVVDFLSVHWHYKVWQTIILNWEIRLPLVWPAFNVADIALSLAVTSLAIMSFKADATPKLNKEG